MKRILFLVLTALSVVCAFVSCDDGEEGEVEYAGVISDYEGTWICENTELRDGCAPVGTIMSIDELGNVSWTTPSGKVSHGQMKILTKEWVDITFGGSLRGEWSTSEKGEVLTLNVNGLHKGNSFPFDGRYRKVKKEQ